MFCNHNWKKDWSHTDLSAFDKAIGAGLTSIKHAQPEFFQSRHLVIYRCQKCGKLKTFKM